MTVVFINMTDKVGIMKAKGKKAASQKANFEKLYEGHFKSNEIGFIFFISNVQYACMIHQNKGHYFFYTRT